MTVQAPDDFSSAAQWADAYRQLGLAVIPAGPEKRPYGKWKEFTQNGIPQAAHDRWYGAGGDNTHNMRMGFLTGAASIRDGRKLLVIDLDLKPHVSGMETWDRWIGENELGCMPETWTAHTGGGGTHIYFWYPDTLSIGGTQLTFPGVDVRADGGFIMAPPSRHASGKLYEWEQSPFETDLAEAPQWLLDLIGASREPHVSPAQHERVEAAGATDAWGNTIDGRDAKMRDIVWRVVVDMHRECPIPPSAETSEMAMLAAYEGYAARTRPQNPTNTLEDEGRGLTAFRAKWAYAMGQWDTKVAAAAAVPTERRPTNDSGLNMDWGSKPTPDAPAPIKAVDFMTLMTEEVVEEPDYIEPDFAGPGNFILIAGPPKAQKSFLLQEMLVACATGGDFLAGQFRVQRPLRVFYLQAEMNRKLLRKRAREIRFLSAEQRDLLRTNLIVSERFHMVLNEGGVEAAVGVIREYFPEDPPDIIAIDPMANVFDQENENDGTQVMRFLTGRLEAVRQKVNPLACIVLVHHASKKSSDELALDPFSAIRGSGALRGYYDSAIVIFRASQEGSERKVHFELRGGESPEPMTVTLSQGRFAKADPMDGIDKPKARQILSAIKDAWDRNAPWSPHPRSRAEGRYVAENASRMFGVSPSAVDEIVQKWLLNSVVAYRPVVQRKRPAGLEVIGGID